MAIELDPEVLAPPPAPAPPAPAPPAAKKHGGEPKPEPPAIELEVQAPSGAVRPTAVLPVEVTVTDGGDKPLLEVTVCNSLPPSLKRLKAPGASVDGARACWRLGKLGPGKSRHLRTTALVGDGAAGVLRSTTTVAAGNAKSRRAVTRIRVAPLADTPCSRPGPGAARCRSSRIANF